MTYKFNHLKNEYEDNTAEREALSFRGTHAVEVWQDGEHVATVDVDIYSDVEYVDFDRNALERLGEFVNQEYVA